MPTCWVTSSASISATARICAGSWTTRSRSAHARFTRPPRPSPFQREGQAPILIQLDDLHWSDDGSLEFLKHLVHVNRDVPMLVLCLTRPSLFERRADLLKRSARRSASTCRRWIKP